MNIVNDHNRAEAIQAARNALKGTSRFKRWVYYATQEESKDSRFSKVMRCAGTVYGWLRTSEGIRRVDLIDAPGRNGRERRALSAKAAKRKHKRVAPWRKFCEELEELGRKNRLPRGQRLFT